MTLKPKHQDTLLGQYLDLVASVNHHKANVAPFYEEMEAWEVKEYKSVNNANLEEIETCKAYMMKHEAIFNQML